MRKSTTIAAVVIVAALAAPASAFAETYFRCSTNRGEFNGTYRATDATLQRWNSNTGWGPDLCREWTCVITTESYELSRETESRYGGKPSRFIQTVTIGRRTGSLRWEGVSMDEATWERNTAFRDSGLCQPIEEPRLAAPQF